MKFSEIAHGFLRGCFNIVMNFLNEMLIEPCSPEYPSLEVEEELGKLGYRFVELQESGYVSGTQIILDDRIVISNASDLQEKRTPKEREAFDAYLAAYSAACNNVLKSKNERKAEQPAPSTQ